MKILKALRARWNDLYYLSMAEWRAQAASPSQWDWENNAEVHFAQPTDLGIKLAAVLDAIYYFIGLAEVHYAFLNGLCKVKGHDWHDDSYGGPESGAISFYCKRCYKGGHTTLY